MATTKTLSQDLQGELESLIQAPKEEDLIADVKVAVYDIKTGLSCGVRSQEKGWAASIIKLPVLVAVLEEAKRGRLSLNERMTIDHRFLLEETDPVSKIPSGSKVTISSLMQVMITASDNEATNILADRVGGPPTVNKYAQMLGLEKTMLGHLLCPGVPRYTSVFNPDGSNMTTPADMAKLIRHLYDPSYSILSHDVRRIADIVLTKTKPVYLQRGGFGKHKVKAKIGYISDMECGDDIHEVGIIDDRLIVSLMANKVFNNFTGLYKDGVKKEIKLQEPFLDLSNKDSPDTQLILGYLARGYEFSSPLENLYKRIMGTIHRSYTTQV